MMNEFEVFLQRQCRLLKRSDSLKETFQLPSIR